MKINAGDWQDIGAAVKDKHAIYLFICDDGASFLRHRTLNLGRWRKGKWRDLSRGWVLRPTHFIEIIDWPAQCQPVPDGGNGNG